MGVGTGDVGFFEEHGYLLVEDVLDSATLKEVNRVTGEFVRSSGAVQASNERYDIGPGHCEAAPVVRRLKNPHVQHPIYDRIMRSAAIVDVVEALIGPGVRFHHSKLNFKPPGGSAAVEWHQDWAFYPHTNDGLVAVGLMLEDCGSDNGPLMVLPGSHRGPTYNHHYNGYFAGAVNLDEEVLDARHAVALTGRAGSMTVHHVRAVHGSRENTTASTRPLLIYSYMALDAWPLDGFAEFSDIEEFDSRILRGQPTLEARQEALPIRMPFPVKPAADGIYDDQAEVRGRSFAVQPESLRVN